MKIWKDLVKVHCSKSINKEARENIKTKDYTLKEEEIITDFDDTGDASEEAKYGRRKKIRASSDFRRIFQKPIDELKESEKHITRIDNVLYCIDLVETMTTQHLSLFPFISATPLDKGLTTNSYVELHWKDCRRIFKNIDRRLMWPLLYLTTLNNEYRNKALAIMTMKHVPSLKFGRPRIDKLKLKAGNNQPCQQQTVDNSLFMPSPLKKRKTSTVQNETYSSGKEKWTPKKDRTRAREGKNSGGNYIMNKKLDYENVIRQSNLPIESLTVTGSRRNLTTLALEKTPHMFKLNKKDIEDIQKKNAYVTNDVIDAFLSLLDKKLNEDHFSLGVVHVIFVQNCRLMLTSENKFLPTWQGKFLAVMPRNFSLTDYETRRELAEKGELEGFEPGSHYTLVSNLYCKDYEVNIYETWDPLSSSPEAILTAEGKKLLKILSKCDDKPLKVNVIDVSKQEEAECGLLACALAVQLCFYGSEERTSTRKILDVRKTVLRCFQNNELVDFPTSRRNDRDSGHILYSLTI